MTNQTTTLIRRLRLRKQAEEGRSISIGEVAQVLGISRETLGNIERGTQQPSLKTLAAICGYYGADEGEVLRDAVQYDVDEETNASD